ncbi:MAG: hypothetical protein O9311_08085 [Cytophagales bacterium]|nr:hypothetical protein [Cytophagales bacterium]
MKTEYLFFLLVLATACHKKYSREDVIKNIREVDYEGVKLPEPRFDVDLEQLVQGLKEKYGAEGAVIGRPIMFTSKDDYDSWLKVEFLNAELDGRDFREFCKEVAESVLEKLSNKDDFKRIEISSITEKGFAITFTTKQNTFFDMDSLRIEKSK